MKKIFLTILTLFQASTPLMGMSISAEQSADDGKLCSPGCLLTNAIKSLNTQEAKNLIEEDPVLLTQYQELFHEKKSHSKGLITRSLLENLIKKQDPRSIAMMALLLEKGISPDGIWSDGKTNNLGGVLTCDLVPENRFEKIILLLQANTADLLPLIDGSQYDFLPEMHHRHSKALSEQQKMKIQDMYLTRSHQVYSYSAHPIVFEYKEDENEAEQRN